ncbi:MAG: tyrosine-type recombinase/integrase [Candidatus Paracaedibacter sp.]
MDKVLEGVSGHPVGFYQGDSLVAWAGFYYRVHVNGSPLKTEQAKQRDLNKFLAFVTREVGHDHIDSWTPAVTKHFLQSLKNTISENTQQPYKATTINRILATVRHFARWLHKQRPLQAGDPFVRISDIQTDAPDWNGLTSRQLMRLKSACEQRLILCTRKNQNPALEIAVFYLLLQTGLRESEVVSLNVHQYHHRGLHQVLRHKSKRVSTKVPLPSDAREFLEVYLKERHPEPHEPLFLNRYGQRLTVQDVQRICNRILRQASVNLEEDDKFHFTPHKLRHTFLKKAADKHGLHFAHEASGNVSIKEIFRYAKPSQEEIDEAVEELFASI